MQYNFGTGLLTLTPSGSNPTPIQAGVLQDVSLDIEETMAELRGQYQFPVDVAQAAGSIKGKAKFARIFASLLSGILSGSTQTTGSTRGAINEVGTIPSTPFQITVAQSATFVEDLGVINATTGLQMTRVSSAPATGQYSVSAGVYTFAAADVGNVAWISYSYTSASGKKVTFNNQLMGSAPTFTLTIFNSYGGNHMGFKLFAVKAPKLSLAMKNTDYTMQDLDFVAFANTTGQVLEAYSSE